MNAFPNFFIIKKFPGREGDALPAATGRRRPGADII